MIIHSHGGDRLVRLSLFIFVEHLEELLISFLEDLIPDCYFFFCSDKSAKEQYEKLFKIAIMNEILQEKYKIRNEIGKLMRVILFLKVILVVNEANM